MKHGKFNPMGISLSNLSPFKIPSKWEGFLHFPVDYTSPLLFLSAKWVLNIWYKANLPYSLLVMHKRNSLTNILSNQHLLSHALFCTPHSICSFLISLLVCLLLVLVTNWARYRGGLSNLWEDVLNKELSNDWLSTDPSDWLIGCELGTLRFVHCFQSILAFLTMKLTNCEGNLGLLSFGCYCWPSSQPTIGSSLLWSGSLYLSSPSQYMSTSTVHCSGYIQGHWGAFAWDSFVVCYG